MFAELFDGVIFDARSANKVFGSSGEFNELWQS
jgi:hypothetical protein